MKLKIAKNKLLDGLQIVQNIVGTRTTLPILSNVRARALPDRMELTTTDLDIAISCEVEAETLRQGATTLPVRRLFSVVKELPTADVEIEVDEKNTATIRYGSSFFRLLGLPQEDFPPMPKAGGGKTLQLEQKTLRGLLRKTFYAMSTDETRYQLNGVLISAKDDKLTAVATDGRRLALAEHELELPRGTSIEMITPAKVVAELQRLLGDNGNMHIGVTENHASFELCSGPKDDKRNIHLICKLIEGTFPNYRQVIPTEPKERLTLEREAFLAALHRVSLLTSDKSNSVKLTFAKNTMAVTVNSPDVGEARETLPVTYKGKELAIAFNPQYLMDPLRNLDADEIFLELVDELSPGVIKVNEPFLYVVMPMRMN